MFGGHRIISRDENPRAGPVSFGEIAQEVRILVFIDMKLRSRNGVAPAFPELSSKATRQVGVEDNQTETGRHRYP